MEKKDFDKNDGRPTKITREAFDKLKVRMTLKQVQEILGDLGGLASAGDVDAAFGAEPGENDKRAAWRTAAMAPFKVFRWKEDHAIILASFSPNPGSKDRGYTSPEVAKRMLPIAMVEALYYSCADPALPGGRVSKQVGCPSSR